MNSRARHRLAWICFAAYWAVLLALTHLPGDRLPRTRMGDKSAHVLAYAGWAVLATVAIRRPGWLWLVLPAGMLAGALDELTQPWVGRYCDLRDWIADSIGLAAGLLIGLVLRRLAEGRAAVSPAPAAGPPEPSAARLPSPAAAASPGSAD